MLDTILDRDPINKGNVSKIYKLISADSSPFLNKTISSWEQDLNIQLSDETWKHSSQRIHHTFLCLRHRLIQFKVLHRLHYTREKLSKLCPNSDPTCIWCHLHPATVGHMFWDCSLLSLIETQFIFSQLFHIFAIKQLIPAQLPLFLVFPVRA